LSHLVHVVSKFAKTIFVASDGSVLDILLALSCHFRNTQFVTVGPAMNEKDKGRYPRVKTVAAATALHSAVVIDLALPQLATKQKKQSAQEATKDYETDIRDRFNHYLEGGAKKIILCARLYRDIRNSDGSKSVYWMYSYFPHALAGYVTNFDLAQDLPDAHTAAELGVLEVKWDTWFRTVIVINKLRTFFSLTMSHMDCVRGYELAGKKYYIRHYYRQILPDPEVVTDLTVAQKVLVDPETDIGESTSEDPSINDDFLGEVPVTTWAPNPGVNSTGTVAPPQYDQMPSSSSFVPIMGAGVPWLPSQLPVKAVGGKGVAKASTMSASSNVTSKKDLGVSQGDLNFEADENM